MEPIQIFQISFIQFQRWVTCMLPFVWGLQRAHELSSLKHSLRFHCIFLLSDTSNLFFFSFLMCLIRSTIGCGHMALESRSERRFRTWFGPFLIWKPDFSPCERKAVSNQAFATRKKGVLDRDPPRKPDSRTCERKALSERDLCVCSLTAMRNIRPRQKCRSVVISE